MYPNIAPDLKVRSTISHPIRSEEVIGFHARNTKLGRSAVVMKEDSLEDGTVIVPAEGSATLLNEDAELVVLDGDEVLAMEASDFATQREVRDVEGRGDATTVSIVSRDSEKFHSWDENVVDISN